MRLVSYVRLNQPERRYSPLYLIFGILGVGCLLMISADWAASYSGSRNHIRSYPNRPSASRSQPSPQFEELVKPTEKDPKEATAAPRTSSAQLQEPVYMDRIRHISLLCGKVCDEKAHTTGEKYRHLPLSQEQCSALYQYPSMHMKHPGMPMQTIPSALIGKFTMYGRMELRHEYAQNQKGKKFPREWRNETIDDYKEEMENEEFTGPYGTEATEELLSLLERLNVRNKSVLVFDGGDEPWVEAAALFLGAKETVTVGNDSIKCEHNRMISYSHKQFSQAFLNGTLTKFDMVIAYGALESAGLGSMGEQLNPWGDIISLVMAWCASGKDAKLILEVPRAKVDQLYFNSYRVYGPERLKLLTTNWLKIINDNDNSWDWELPVYSRHSRVMAFERMD